MNQDSYTDMLAAVQAFHDKHDFKNTGGEELMYRMALTVSYTHLTLPTNREV